MPAIQLARGQKVERGGKESDPRRAANRMQQNRKRIHSRKNLVSELTQHKRYTEDDVCVLRYQAGHDSRMRYAVN